MNEFLTWQVLLTVGGCTIGTGVLVQLFKQYINLPTQVFSYLVAFAILNVGALCVGIWNPAYLGISVLNAGIVALASNGAYSAISTGIAAVKGKITNETLAEFSNGKGDDDE